MTDIEKLKQEAEDRRQKTILAIAPLVSFGVPDSKIVDLMTAASMYIKAEIALQAAEQESKKEVRGKFYLRGPFES